MGRPIKRGLDYYPHDTSASSDPKLEPILMLYGLEGYGFYFLLLEYIYRSDNFEYDISDAEIIKMLCKRMSIDENRFQELLTACLKYRCFDKNLFDEKGCISSNGVKKRAKVVIYKREKMKKNYDEDKSR